MRTTRVKHLLRSLLVALPLAAMSSAAMAHHAFSAEFDIDKPVELKGTLTKVRWTNPHSWIYIDVPGEGGGITSWAIEFGAPGALRRRGFSATDFPIGMQILVRGYRAKSGRTVANASAVKLPDGRDLYAGDPEGPDAPGSSSDRSRSG